MNALAHANGHSLPIPRAAESPSDPLAAPRFTIEPALLPPASDPPEAADAAPSDAVGSAAENNAASRPPTTRRYNSFRDRQERVSSIQQLLPRKVPRLRDLQIYDSVVMEKMSQHMVAEIFGLTQVRILQIVREVRAWKSTVPYDIPGMTEEQQINLATHETRQWLDRIRDKCLEMVELTATRESKTHIDENKMNPRRTVGERSVAPKPGFLSVALAAVIHAGKLGGAGEQWARTRNRDAGGENAPGVTSRSEPQPQIAKAAVPAPAGQSHDDGGMQAPQKPASETGRPQSPALNRAAAAPHSPPGHLSKEKIPGFSVRNGKANGHATSAFRRRAQVELTRRRKKRQIAYQSAAEREGIQPQSRPRFFRLLRELDRIADRVADRVEADMRRSAAHGAADGEKTLLHRLRHQYLKDFLAVGAGILTPPYDEAWVWDRYCLDTGRFRWDEEERSNEPRRDELQPAGASCQEPGN